MASGLAMNCIKLVVFDLAGTTVYDTIGGLPLVTVAMKAAFSGSGIDITLEDVNKFRGFEKRAAVEGILREVKEGQASAEDVDRIYEQFKVELDRSLMLIDKEIAGATATIKALKEGGVKIAAGSGFPHGVVETLVQRMGWADLLDYYSSAEKEGAGRPDPALIRSAMKHCGIDNPKHVLKVGDTTVDVEEGKNAGCWTAAVLTGTQSEETLTVSKPDFILSSVAEVPELLADHWAAVPALPFPYTGPPPYPANRPKIGVLVFHWAQEFDFTAPFDLLGMWYHYYGGPEPVAITNVPGGGVVHCAMGLDYSVKYDYATCPPLEALLIPGGSGTRPLMHDLPTRNFLRKQAKQCKNILSVCTGSLVLAKCGLLEGKKATTHHKSLLRLSQFPGVTVDEKRWVRDGNVWTSAGVSAGVDMILAFIEDQAGMEVAGKVQLHAEYYPDKVVRPAPGPLPKYCQE
eukprot:comp24168_c0_seq1/m.44083 comp24168_c0_seq1/g.44083  ORF comp24168_c0_seq1/g.44083 comp24168_c0_seq1/m.44083 type:complete len:460 (-) comp24168_c0_seq1:71-1450(-)